MRDCWRILHTYQLHRCRLWLLFKVRHFLLLTRQYFFWLAVITLFTFYFSSKFWNKYFFSRRLIKEINFKFLCVLKKWLFIHADFNQARFKLTIHLLQFQKTLIVEFYLLLLLFWLLMNKLPLRFSNLHTFCYLNIKSLNLYNIYKIEYQSNWNYFLNF